jgi:hypothetical protein
MAKWIRKLMKKKPFRLVSGALANKLARIAWVVLTRKEAYRQKKHNNRNWPYNHANPLAVADII